VRIILIPIFIYLYFAHDGSIIAVWPTLILLLSGFTDWLDGFIARKYKFVTYVGKILDPAADKLTQFSVCLAVGIKNPFFLIVAAAYFIKELTMLIGGLLLTKKKIKIAGAKWFGKFGTAAFYAIMLLVLLFPNMDDELSLTLCVVLLAILIFVCIMYVPVFFELVKNGGEKEEEIEG
jgi:cardiolipin synthase